MSTWDLKEFVDAACAINCALADQEFEAALGRAKKTLQEHPQLAAANLVTSVICGDEDALAEHLQQNLQAVNQKQGPRNWEPLLYLCCSRFLRDPLSSTQVKNILTCAKLLLENGADPNAFFMLGDEKETALYAACGVCNSAALVEMLLQAGADVNDEDASYHVAEFADTECVRILFVHGMAPDLKATVLLRKLDFEDPAGVQSILDYGADVNARGRWGKTPLQQAIMRGRSRQIIELLIDRGADVNALRDDGKSAYYLAARFGRGDIADLLVQRGADRKLLSGVDAIVAQLGLGDLALANKIADLDAIIVEDFDETDKTVIVDAARNGNIDAVKAILDFGLDIATQDNQGFSALHWAAWYGHVELVKYLIDRGAPLELENNYGGTVIDSTVWGYANSDGNDENAEPILKMLAAAGADHGKISPFPSGNKRVDAILVSLGLAPKPN
jgi:ankyrin repeat protein